MDCQSCKQRKATVHLTEIKSGKKIEKHLCEQCAAQNEGLPVKSHMPINELLTNFVMAHSGLQKEQGTTCEHCGITWAEFRQHGLFGCEHDYDLFEKDLTPLLQRAHESATHHTGKVPTRAGGTTGGVPKKRKTIDVAKLQTEAVQRTRKANRRLRDEARARADKRSDFVRTLQPEPPAPWQVSPVEIRGPSDQRLASGLTDRA